MSDILPIANCIERTIHNWQRTLGIPITREGLRNIRLLYPSIHRQYILLVIESWGFKAWSFILPLIPCNHGFVIAIGAMHRSNGVSWLQHMYIWNDPPIWYVKVRHDLSKPVQNRVSGWTLGWEYSADLDIFFFWSLLCLGLASCIPDYRTEHLVIGKGLYS